MTSSGLIVRRSERFEISIPARVRVASHHCETLRFVKGLTDADRWIEVDVIDFAAGGVGFIAEVFMPRNLDLELDIRGVGDGGPAGPVLRCPIRIKRVQMTDRRPAYQIGCSFGELSEECEAMIDAMLDRLRGLADETERNGGAHA